MAERSGRGEASRSLRGDEIALATRSCPARAPPHHTRGGAAGRRGGGAAGRRGVGAAGRGGQGASSEACSDWLGGDAEDPPCAASVYTPPARGGGHAGEAVLRSSRGAAPHAALNRAPAAPAASLAACPRPRPCVTRASRARRGAARRGAGGGGEGGGGRLRGGRGGHGRHPRVLPLETARRAAGQGRHRHRGGMRRRRDRPGARAASASRDAPGADASAGGRGELGRCAPRACARARRVRRHGGLHAAARARVRQVPPCARPYPPWARLKTAARPRALPGRRHEPVRPCTLRPCARRQQRCQALARRTAGGGRGARGGGAGARGGCGGAHRATLWVTQSAPPCPPDSPEEAASARAPRPRPRPLRPGACGRSPCLPAGLLRVAGA